VGGEAMSVVIPPNGQYPDGMTPATGQEVIEVLWARLRDGTAHRNNWGTALDNNIWHVGHWTYINGIMLIVDFDYEGMWLLEVCDRDPDDHTDPTQVRWLVVGTVHGETHHAWYPTTEPQEFFNRTINAWDVMPWAMEWYKDHDLASKVPETDESGDD